MKLLPLLCLLLLPLLFSCTKKTSQDKNSLFVALESAPKTLDPRFATDANGQRIVNLLFQSFLRLGPEMNIIGEAATQWSLKPESLWLKVPKPLFFSDGKEVTKEDLEFSFQEYRKPENIFSSSFRAIESLSSQEYSEHFEITLKLKESSATLLTDLTNLKILPKDRILMYGVDFQNHLAGSGPYQYVKRVHNNLYLKRNPHYRGEKPKTENLVFKVVKDDNTRFLKLIKGGVDLAPNVLSPQSTAKLLKDSRFQIVRSPGLAMNYILVNLKDPYLKHLALRKAIAHSIDRENIIQYKLEGLGNLASSILTPGNPFFKEDLHIPLYSLEKAKKEFQKLKDTPNTLTLKTSNNPTAVENAKVIAHQMEKLGISVKIESYEWGTFYSDIKSGNYQLATMRWVGATDPDIYRVAFHSKEFPPGRNRGYYSNPKLDQLLEEGTKILDEKKRIHHYYKVQEIIAEDLPIIPLWYGQQVNIFNQSLHGFKSSLTGDFSYLMLLYKE